MSSFNLPDFTGHIVDEGHLHLTEVLGAGTYGVVYKALDTASSPGTAAHYAVKCLGPLAPNSSQGSRHDEREVKLHTLCSSHPNVITLHRRFCHEGCLFIVLELSAGGHLFDAIDRGVFRENDTLVRDVFLQLIDTPENILCSAEGGDIRIADFGLATDSALPSSSAGGSASYMSPESLTIGSESESYLPPQSDIWALCIILLNMMSGLYPWRKALASDAGFDAFLTDARYLRDVFPISDPLDELLERCFRPVPHTRPTLLQLRTEITRMPAFFAPPGAATPRPAAPSYSAPTTPSASFALTCPSFAFTSVSTPSKATSASFDALAQRPSTKFGTWHPIASPHGSALFFGASSAPSKFDAPDACPKFGTWHPIASPLGSASVGAFSASPTHLCDPSALCPAHTFTLPAPFLGSTSTAPSTNPRDPSALWPTPKVTTHPLNNAPRPSSARAPAAPTPKMPRSRNPLARLLRWLKKTRRAQTKKN